MAQVDNYLNDVSFTTDGQRQLAAQRFGLKALDVFDDIPIDVPIFYRGKTLNKRDLIKFSPRNDFDISYIFFELYGEQVVEKLKTSLYK